MSYPSDPKLLDLLYKRLAEILVEIDSQDRYVGCLALEALAVELMRLLDMSFAATRLRVQTAGDAVAELIFESAHVVDAFNREAHHAMTLKHMEL